MTRDEALAILPPEVAAAISAQMQAAPLSEHQLDEIARLFAKQQAGGAAPAEPMEQAS